MTNKPDKSTGDKPSTASRPETAEQQIRRAIQEHEAHHKAFVLDDRRHDVDEPYMDSLWGIVSARTQVEDVSGVSAARQAALDELIAAYHEQVVRMKRGRRGELNRFWQAWDAVKAIW